MKPNTFIFLCFFLTFSLFTRAQNVTQKKADALYDNFAFTEAIPLYQSLLKNNHNTSYVTQRLGDCYSYMREPENAVTYYESIINQDNLPVAYYYKYAQALRGIKNYEASRKWLNIFQQKGGDISNTILKDDAKFINTIYNGNQHYILKNAAFNSVMSDFGAYEFKDTVYFASSINKGVLAKHKHAWDAQPFLDMYATPKTTDTIIHHKAKLRGKINSTYHDGPLVITKDGKTMYFSRNNYNTQVLGKSDKGINHLKLYKANFIRGKWRNVKALPFNNNNYSIGHPALNSDETKLYFSSDMPGGQGGSDIYYVSINTDGSYGNPTNAGNVINTPKNELFPFLNAKNVLFFASDGHHGIGLLDIYATVYNADKTPRKVTNLGLPINSSKDDFAFYMHPKAKTGYIASNRAGGLGKDDIYSFTVIPPLELKGRVKQALQNTPLPNATVTLTDKKGDTIAYTETNTKGNYTITVNRNTTYTVTASKKEYENYEMAVSTEGLNPLDTLINANFTLKKQPVIVAEKPVTLPKDLGAIFFKFDSAEIEAQNTSTLTTVINKMLNSYPDVAIKIEAFSDSRGPEAYNTQLSQRRANATYNYLINNGIPASRITTYKGYGVHESTKNCSTSTPCSKDSYKLSRRTNFIVVNPKNLK